MNIIQKPLSELIAYERNNKDHPQNQVDLLARSIQEFGFNVPIIIDKKGVIIAGHGRLEAAKMLALELVPCLVKDDLSEDQVRKYRILDNKLAELSIDNVINLKYELEALQDIELNLLFPDFGVITDDEAAREEIEDDVPAVSETIIVEPGDVFQLGEHILIYGDATKTEDVAKLMGDDQADMIFTDPPYNVNYKGQGENTSNGILNDKMSDTAFLAFLNVIFANYRTISKDTAGVYVFHSTSTQIQFEQSLRANGFEIKNQLIWNKPSAALGWGAYRWKHEPFFYCSTTKANALFYGDRTHDTVIDLHACKSEKQLAKAILRTRELEKEGMTTIWSMKRENVNGYVHPTQKPVELIGYALENSSKRWEIVVDFFGGSGSTLIACEKHGRACRTMELDPKYIQTIIKRYHTYTGGKKDIACLNRALDLSPIF